MTTSVYASNTLHREDDNEAWTKIFEFVPRGTSVLDVGCSSGNLGKELITKKGCTVTGIEPNKSDADLARRNLDKVYARNIETDPIDDLPRFDVIVMADVIEHLMDPVPALKKIKRHLGRGGILVFSVPNMANISVRLELLRGRFEYADYGVLDQTHLHYYDRIQLEMVLQQAGFSVEVYNNTIRDVPRKVLVSYLNKLGLHIKSESKFRRIFSSVDAISFQFIGVARSSQKSHAVTKSKTPYDFMSKYIDDVLDRASSQNKKLRQENAKLESELCGKRKELQDIYSSRAWKVISGLRRLMRSIR